jgi:hypothetical protein
LVISIATAAVPVGAWRRRRVAAHRAAQECWPRLLEELRVLTGSVGRPIPQALIEVGLRGPVEIRSAFVAAQREWALTTDFDRVVSVLKQRLDDPSADATFETLLIAHQVGGDIDRRLQALAEDRRADVGDRKEAAAKQSGARFARWFVIIVPAGMAVAGLSVGDGQAAYRSGVAQILIAVTFFVLAAYVGVEAVRALATGDHAAASWVGIGLAAVTAVTMPLLAAAKRRVGAQLHSVATVKEAGQTQLCAYLSIALLLGLGANALLGWWWADPLAALVIATVAVHEGRSSWRGEGCCDAC